MTTIGKHKPFDDSGCIIEVMLQAVIMAAGRSTRTHPLTSSRPKPLIPILGKPLLQLQLEQLDRLVDEVIVIVGYRGDAVRETLGERYRSLGLRYVEQRVQKGTGHALLTTASLIRERCLVLNGDDLYHRADLAALARHRLGLLAAKAPDPQNRAVLTVSGGRVRKIVEKPDSPPPESLCSVGAYMLESSTLPRLRELPQSPRGELELPDFVQNLIEDEEVGYHEVSKIWLPLTHPWDVLSISHRLLGDPLLSRDFGVVATHGTPNGPPLWEGTTVVGPLIVQEDVKFGSGCQFRGPTVIGAGSKFGDNVQVQCSVLFPGVTLGSGARVSHSVLGEGSEVGPRAELHSLPDPGDELQVLIKDRPVRPDLARLGLLAGDHARVPAGSQVPPGTLLAEREEYKSAPPPDRAQ